MAFENITDKLQNVFKGLRSKGKLTEADVDLAMKEIKMALLEADVNFKVVKNFIKTVKEKTVGDEVLGGLNPAQTVVKIVSDELAQLMGSETTEILYRPGQAITVIMMVGLQGAGKTTTAAKIAAQITKKGKRPLLVAADIYRPAAIKQLQINGEKLGIPVFSAEQGTKPGEIALQAIDHASKNNQNVVIIDTAGRLHIDEEMMDELIDIKKTASVFQTLLVVDAMTGQDAVGVASSFDEKVGVDGIILTKLDGDARGGAALSIKSVTGKPILYVGMGEKLEDLEQFHPDRMASRILGMGDMLSLIEKAQDAFDEEQAEAMQKQLKKKKGLDYNYYLMSMNQVRKMGGMGKVLDMMPGMIPGLGNVDTSQMDGVMDDKRIRHTEAIIYSMTPEERENPKLMNGSRKKRIAKGAGLDITEVNRFIKQFEQTQKMMKQMPELMGGKGGRRRGGGLPFNFR